MGIQLERLVFVRAAEVDIPIAHSMRIVWESSFFKYMYYKIQYILYVQDTSVE